MMKAAVYKRYGLPETVRVMDASKPTPGDHEILVKVYASTVNRTDCGFRSANYFVVRFFSGLFNPKYNILGNEFAGQVEAVGANVTSFKAGDRVFGYNDATFGGHAEYLTINENGAVTTIPGNLPYEEAAPLTEGSHYALNYLRAAKIGKGKKILVYGATGAIGSAAVQLAKFMGAEVAAVCPGKYMDLVKSFGADEVIDYSRQDFTKTGKKFDAVLDAVGKTSFGRCKPLLKEKGLYLSTELGRGSQNIFLALITPLLGEKRVLFPIPTINKDDVVYLKRLVEAGHFKPAIDRIYPLEEIVEAYRYVETGQKVGNVVLAIAR